MHKECAEEIAKEVINGLISTFADVVSAITLLDVTDIPSKSFHIEYVVYNYFCMRFNYDKGHFGTCIIYGENAVSVNTELEWDDNCDFSKYWQEVKDEVRLRIPDKYLEKYGW